MGAPETVRGPVPSAAGPLAAPTKTAPTAPTTTRPPTPRPAQVGLLPIGRRPRPGPSARHRYAPGRPMPADRLRGWLVALTLALVGGVLRFYRLGYPTDGGTPVFDEKHYVPQAWQMVRNGGFEDNPGYELVVHPPLAKQLIAVGELLFGYDGMGWRFSAALAGTVCVLLVVRIARRLTRSTLLGGVAGVLVLADGVSFVSSRMGMLDIFLTLFVLATFGCLLVDRDDVRTRMTAVVAQGRVWESPFGPRWGVRWWRFGAGVAIGLACAVKWSGVYWLVAFGVLAVCWDLSLRRGAGVSRPWAGTVVRDVAPALWALAAVPVLTYLADWWAWFSSETGTDRHVVGQAVGEGGRWSLLPDGLRALWYYSGHVLGFHEGLSTSRSHPHPWESKPWSWPMGLRPMLYYYSGDGDACGQAECVTATMLIGTPALWWLSPVALGWSLWRVLAGLDWRYAALLVGYGAGYLPWFANLDRQMYYFYATPLAPFLVLALTLGLGEILGPAGVGGRRRRIGLAVVSLYLGAAVANFGWLWPIMVGDTITTAQWDAQMWLPSWR